MIACPDTGSEENIISADLVRSLGLPIREFTELQAGSPSKTRQFVLANGNTMEAIGEVEVLCAFGNRPYPLSSCIRVIFNVFLQLAAPIIIGMCFLEDTETMTKHRDRLIRVPSYEPVRVYSMGRLKKELMCFVDKQLTFGLPDTGSEIDLMSTQFASERRLKVEEKRECIEFADGSFAIASGVVKAKLSLDEHASATAPIVEFLVLENLIHDVLLGEKSIEEFEIFTKHQNSVLSTMGPGTASELNWIRLAGNFERIFGWIRRRIRLRRRHERL